MSAKRRKRTLKTVGTHAGRDLGWPVEVAGEGHRLSKGVTPPGASAGWRTSASPKSAARKPDELSDP